MVSRARAGLWMNLIGCAPAILFVLPAPPRVMGGGFA
jgi:hypothetical protein